MRRDPPDWFGVWFRENGHRFDWGTLRWCEMSGGPDGCYQVENVTLDELGHVLVPRPPRQLRRRQRLRRRRGADVLTDEAQGGLERPRLRALRRRDAPAAVRRPDHGNAVQHLPRRPDRAVGCGVEVIGPRRGDGDVHGHARAATGPGSCRTTWSAAGPSSSSSASRSGWSDLVTMSAGFRRRHIHRQRERLGNARLPRAVPQAVQRGPPSSSSPAQTVTVTAGCTQPCPQLEGGSGLVMRPGVRSTGHGARRSAVFGAIVVAVTACFGADRLAGRRFRDAGCRSNRGRGHANRVAQRCALRRTSTATPDSRRRIGAARRAPRRDGGRARRGRPGHLLVGRPRVRLAVDRAALGRFRGVGRAAAGPVRRRPRPGPVDRALGADPPRRGGHATAAGSGDGRPLVDRGAARAGAGASSSRRGSAAARGRSGTGA